MFKNTLNTYKNAPLLLQIPIKNALDQKEEYGNLW